ncbi:MAG: hypothetical protein ACYTEZ_08020 [Planctomycetota bacterium]|jgi:hypothetical protein
MRGVWVAVLLLAASVAAAPSRAKPIPVGRGLPKPEGVGKLVIVSNLPARDGRFEAIKRLAAHRRAGIVKFKGSKIATVRKALLRAGPEFVAVAVTPETVDINFHYEVLELCRDLDRDPMPDFHFGYLCARTGEDLARMVDRIIQREKEPPPTPVAKVVALTGNGKHLEGLDYFLHFGHGQAWRVEQGMTGEQVGRLSLPRAPIVWSGACFNGVLSRSYHKCAYQLIFLAPTTIDPEHLMSLNWVHAGASGYFAALEGDRGEMAMAEWDYFRARACTLGEVIGYQYRLAFTSVYADFTKFPRHIPGQKKKMSFYNVMLRGMVSRLLLSDPAYRPLAKPLRPPVNDATVAHDPAGRTLTVTVQIAHYAPGEHLNYLPRSNRGVFDMRLYHRVALPADAPRALGEPRVEAQNGAELIDLTRHHVRHEVWGGRRYLNLQVEAPWGRFKTGTTATYVFPLAKR